MNYIVNKSSISGAITVPTSKSQTLRAILFASLGLGKSHIHNHLQSPDIDAMIQACRLFGVKIEVTDGHLTVNGLAGSIHCTENVIDAGNSGIVLRFCGAVGSLSSHPVVVTGDASVRHRRVIQPLLDGLNQLGVRAESMRGDGGAPIIVKGPLQSGCAVISGEDSQPVSGILIASAFAPGPVTLNVKNPGEKPWVAMTLSWFDRLGIDYQHHNFERYQMAGKSSYEGFEYHVPGDLSSAAFPIAAALITQSELTLYNVDLQEMQGDKELISIFQQMGAGIEWDFVRKTLSIQPKAKLRGVSVDINNCVDAVTILAAVACFAEGTTHIQNAAIARNKECNRLQGITEELRKMGAHIHETADGLVVQGSKLRGSEVHSYHDHRMAMSLAVAGLGAEGKTKITSTECVSKTFPSFIQDFNAIGASISEE